MILNEVVGVKNVFNEDMDITILIYFIHNTHMMCLIQGMHGLGRMAWIALSGVKVIIF